MRVFIIFFTCFFITPLIAQHGKIAIVATGQERIEDTLPPVPDVGLLPAVTGDCSVTLSAIPTATDNIAGSVTATTTDLLTYFIPGTYTVVWHYDDGNGNIATQNQTVTINPNTNVVKPEVHYEVCGNGVPGYGTFYIHETKTMFVSAPFFDLTYFLTEADANANTNAIPLEDTWSYPITNAPQMLYVNAWNYVTGCTSRAKLYLEVGPGRELHSYTRYACDADGDGVASFPTLDLYKFVIDDPIFSEGGSQAVYISIDDIINHKSIWYYNTDNFYSYHNTSNPQVIYVVIKLSADECPSIAEVTLIAVPEIPPPVVTANQSICGGSGKTIADLQAVGDDLKWYNDASLGVPLPPETLLVDNHVYYVTQTSGCESQPAAVTVTLPPYPSAPVVQPEYYLCEKDHPTLADINGITGQNIKYYDVADGLELPLTTSVSGVMHLFATQTVNGCESATNASFTVTAYNTPAPTGNALQTFCTSQQPVLHQIQATGANQLYYNSPTSLTALGVDTPMADGMTVYITQTEHGCESVQRLAVTITLLSGIIVHDITGSLCDAGNDNRETVNLSDYESLIAAGTGYDFSYYNSYAGADNATPGDIITSFASFNLSAPTIIYVRVAAGNCHNVASMALAFIPTPVIPLEARIALCRNQYLYADAGPGFVSYQWSGNQTTQTIRIDTEGSYSVTVTQADGCTTTRNFTVYYSDAAAAVSIATNDMTLNGNTITVYATGEGNYEYSLDGLNYQDSNVFSGLQGGQYEVFTRDKNGCGTVTEEVYLLMYPIFFTPNGDGFNDNWKVDLSIIEPGLHILIFDRYGKFLKEILYDNAGWNGTYNGRDMPADDYWFLIRRPNGKEYRGHFSLKR